MGEGRNRGMKLSALLVGSRGTDAGDAGLSGGGALRVLGALLSVALSGCITVYQPMQGLHRPLAINIDYANFSELKIALHCIPSDAIERADAQDLCRKVARLLENQGADVEMSTRLGRITDAAEAKIEAAAEAKAAAQDPTIQRRTMALSIELRARLIHEDEAVLLWWDPTSAYTFAQDITIRDEKGFLLVRDTFMARFVTRLGFFSGTEETFSKDYYAQLSQLTLNAKLRRQVLREGDARYAPPRTVRVKAVVGAAGSAGDAEAAAVVEGGAVRGVLGVLGGVEGGVEGGVLGGEVRDLSDAFKEPAPEGAPTVTPGTGE